MRNDVVKDPHLCRVCGYYSEEPPWGLTGDEPTFDICPCCGVEWGYEDATQLAIERYRNAWLASGAQWYDPTIPSDDLSPSVRLARIGVHR